MKPVHRFVVATLIAAVAMTSAYAQTPTPGFNNKIPEQVLTPNTVETRIGTLNFVDGVPTAETTRLVYDHLDFLRGVEVFLNFIPAASMEGIRLGMARLGATRSNQVVIFDQLMDSNPLFLTGNTDTVYCMVMLDLQADGPTVVEIPPGSGPGTVNDAFFRFVVDMGAPGPDKGKGGKYLIVPPGYKGELPKEGYFVARSTSYVNWVPLRGFRQAGRGVEDVPQWREGLSAQQGGQPAGDAVHQRVESAGQHDSRQQLRVLQGARSRNPEGAGRFHRSRAARPGSLDRHHQGQEVRT
jgi:hypothetical protein